MDLSIKKLSDSLNKISISAAHYNQCVSLSGKGDDSVPFVPAPLSVHTYAFFSYSAAAHAVFAKHIIVQ